jgi:hypothetical protein
VLLNAFPRIASQPLISVLECMHSLAVVPVARGVIRAELMQMRQASAESFRRFSTRVRAKAETGGYVTITRCHCPCKEEVTSNHTEDIIRDVLLAGISCTQIRREALSAEGLQQKSVNDVIAFVEAREMAGQEVRGVHKDTPTLSAVSSFKRNVKVPQTSQREADESMSVPCPECGKAYRRFKPGKRGWNKTPFKNCFDCWRKGNEKRRDMSKSQSVAGTIEYESKLVTAICASQISTVACSTSSNVLEHQVFNQGKWSKAEFRKHPALVFNLTMINCNVVVSIRGIADTGAQCNLWGFDDYIKAGFTEAQLKPVSSRFCAADKRPIIIVGAFHGLFEGRSPEGVNISCFSMVYVSRAVTGFFMSYDTMLSLSVLNSKFPTIGGYDARAVMASTEALGNGTPADPTIFKNSITLHQ